MKKKKKTKRVKREARNILLFKGFVTRNLIVFFFFFFIPLQGTSFILKKMKILCVPGENEELKRF